MSQNLSIQKPVKTRICESTIYGLWEVVEISACNQNTEPILVTQRTKYQFLYEMIYLRLKDGVSTHGMWKLSESREGKFRHSIILDEKSEFGIISLDAYELILSDGCMEYKMIRRI